MNCQGASGHGATGSQVAGSWDSGSLTRIPPTLYLNVYLIETSLPLVALNVVSLSVIAHGKGFKIYAPLMVAAPPRFLQDSVVDESLSRKTQGRFIRSPDIKKKPKTLVCLTTSPSDLLLSLVRKFARVSVMAYRFEEIINEYIQLVHARS